MWFVLKCLELRKGWHKQNKANVDHVYGDKEKGIPVKDEQCLLTESHLKLQGVVETARAVCHEMCQPLQGALTFTELMLLEMQKNDPMHDYVEGIKECLEEITSITRKLNKIQTYEVTEYVDGVNIIDIDKASNIAIQLLHSCCVVKTPF